MVEQELYKGYPNAIKNIKICSASLVFEKLQNKITMRYHYITYQNGLNDKEIDITKCWQEYGTLKCSHGSIDLYYFESCLTLFTIMLLKFSYPMTQQFES